MSVMYKNGSYRYLKERGESAGLSGEITQHAAESGGEGEIKGRERPEPRPNGGQSVCWKRRGEARITYPSADELRAVSRQGIII